MFDANFTVSTNGTSFAERGLYKRTISCAVADSILSRNIASLRYDTFTRYSCEQIHEQLVSVLPLIELEPPVLKVFRFAAASPWNWTGHVIANGTTTALAWTIKSWLDRVLSLCSRSSALDWVSLPISTTGIYHRGMIFNPVF